jgi:serine/threonine protein kinase
MPLSIEQDERGFVRRLRMSWLRMATRPISQLDFARQACELLYVLHEKGQVIHLDLRMDNIVLTDEGVSFVDFGSAVRVGENLKQSPMLTTLFTEMMRTSHIQRMLGRMLDTGECTSEVMKDVHGKVDKNVDAFYLAVQIARPDTHPEMKHVIAYDPDSHEARMLKALTAAILRPKNPGKADYKTVADILRGIRRIEAKLNGRLPARLAA